MFVYRNFHFDKAMKILIISCFLLFASHAFGQNFILPDGEYMDTAANNNSACKDYNIYFYQVNGKYPRSSYTILKEAQSFLKTKNNSYEGNGYITFQFTIDCEGKKMNKTRALQTDEKYIAYHFDKGFVEELYAFLNTMDQWKIFKNKTGQTFPYKAFITFKIKNGKVVNIIP